MRSLRALAITAPILFGAPAICAAYNDYDPHVLVLSFADGHSERLSATSGNTCAAALRALATGMWSVVGPRPVDARCQRSDGLGGRR